MIPGLTEEGWKLRKSGWRPNKEGPEYKDKEWKILDFSSIKWDFKEASSPKMQSHVINNKMQVCPLVLTQLKKPAKSAAYSGKALSMELGTLMWWSGDKGKTRGEKHMSFRV